MNCYEVRILIQSKKKKKNKEKRQMCFLKYHKYPKIIKSFKTLLFTKICLDIVNILRVPPVADLVTHIWLNKLNAAWLRSSTGKQCMWLDHKISFKIIFPG